MQSLLPGWASAMSHHPAFVHFPIVLWLTALLYEIFAVARRSDPAHRTAVWLLWLGTLGGTLAVYTGLSAGKLVPVSAGPVLEAHEQLMLASYFLALGLSVFALLAGRRLTHGLKVVVLVGLLILGVLVTLGADRGAEMVFRYGLGVAGKTAPGPK